MSFGNDLGRTFFILFQELLCCGPIVHIKRLEMEVVVAKLKNAGQPRHKIIQITGHANECSLNDYDEVDEGERRTLSQIISGYSNTSTTTRSSETPQSSSSLSVPPTSAIAVLPSSVSLLSSAAALAQTSVPLPTRQTSLFPSQMPVSRSANDPAAQNFNNCTVNIQNYFGLQSTNQASSSRVERQIGEISTSPSVPVRKRDKRRRAYIIDSDED